MKLVLIILFAQVAALNKGVRGKRYGAECLQRCERIYQRSLSRMGETKETIETIISRQLPQIAFRNVCWKAYDNLDCLLHCAVTDSQDLSKQRATIKNKCSDAMRDEEAKFVCVSKYHSFLEVLCSTYMNRAIELSKAGNNDSNEKHETCRYLYYHNLCLTKNILKFCPQSQKIFNRPNLRDYFASFVLPQDDKLFSDEYLDECQKYEFDKAARVAYESAVERRADSARRLYKNKDSRASTVPRPENDLKVEGTSAPLNQFAAGKASVPDETPVVSVGPPVQTKTTKKLFSPEHDLLYTPPNFFYSSIRAMPIKASTISRAHYLYNMQKEDVLDVVMMPTLNSIFTTPKPFISENLTVATTVDYSLQQKSPVAATIASTEAKSLSEAAEEAVRAVNETSKKDIVDMVLKAAVAEEDINTQDPDLAFGQASSDMADNNFSSVISSGEQSKPLLKGVLIHLKPIRKWEGLFREDKPGKKKEQPFHKRLTEVAKEETTDKKSNNGDQKDAPYKSSEFSEEDEMENEVLLAEGTLKNSDAVEGDHNNSAKPSEAYDKGRSLEDAKRGRRAHEQQGTMIVIYAILICVTLITVIALLAVLALRKHFC